MTAKISKWGNSAALRLPSEILKRLSLHIGDRIEIVQKDDAIILKPMADKKNRLIQEAQRIRRSSSKEYAELEGSVEDGL